MAAVNGKDVDYLEPDAVSSIILSNLLSKLC